VTIASIGDVAAGHSLTKTAEGRPVSTQPTEGGMVVKAPSAQFERPTAPAEPVPFDPRSVAMFLVLAYGISWAWVVPLAVTGHTVLQGDGWPTHVPSLAGPMLAAFIVTGWTAGLAGVGDLVARMGRWRIGWRWWLAVLGPLAFFFAVLATMAAAGADVPARGDFGRFSGLPSSLGIVGVAIVVTLVNGFGEETGWRGYALPQLQHRFGPIAASLVIAAAWAAWHIPQFFVLDSYKTFSVAMLPIFVFGLTCGAIVWMWVYSWRRQCGPTWSPPPWFSSSSNGVGSGPAASRSWPPDEHPSSRGGFWLTNHLANPILAPLLRSGVGRRLGRRLAVVRYRGRRTGRIHELVVQYVRDGDVVWIVPGRPERKQWWRNMLNPWPVDIWLVGHHLAGVARVVNEANDRESVGTALARYRVTFPRVTHTSVVVRVDVSPTAEQGEAAQGSRTTDGAAGQASP
jgi:membrane protease YdiL (CAAX protease family)